MFGWRSNNSVSARKSDNLIPKSINLDGQEISYLLKKSGLSKSLRLTIHRQKGLVVSCPAYYPAHQVDRFIIQKKDWILSKLRLRHSSLAELFSFESGQKVTLLGTDYEIVIAKSHGLRPEVVFDNAFLKILTPLGNKLTAEKFFRTWLDRFIKQTLEARVAFYAEQFGLKYNRVTVKNQQSLWGSCSYKKNLNFTKRLIQAPLWLIDYVVCHELAHLTEMNHSERFWSLVGKYYPVYRKAERHLKAWKPTVQLP